MTLSLLQATSAARFTSSPPPAAERQKRVQVPNALRHTIASATAGAVGVTLVAPIEIVRLNILSGLTLGAAASTLKGGLMFRGNTADVIASASRTGIILPAFAYYKNAARALATRLDPDLQPDALLPRWALFGAGAAAGATATLILFPLEVARTRMAMECRVGDSVIGCLEKVWNAEGLAAVYRGLTASLLGVMPFNAM